MPRYAPRGRHDDPQLSTYVLGLAHSISRIIGMYEHKNGPGMTWTTAHATPDGSEEELGRDLATDLDHAMVS
ncbi:hypothetical protein CcaverHIS002_0402750 [Cutaneotrichosporon cavernicola]|nr:hypothetical protein CcaverHIS002_0402750 [Cutaneotrichosporon cavernicola]BEI99225.1 hypothetical protein CcaverHIS631_0402680 [Cutaneotrichosporon cavernicola]BEJ07002.1 hypothetical protein CcaverHIS641_0402710 [Cutaneotrichosporon cavernicola]